MKRKPRAIVAGYVVRHTAGGHLLSIMHWLLGLKELGYHVTFVEHFGWASSCYDWNTRCMTSDPAYGISVAAPLLQQAGVDAWCYVAEDGRCYGLTRQELREHCRNADVLLCLWSATWMEELRDCPVKVFIDTDPGFTQFAMTPEPSAGYEGYASPWDFDMHFSYGTRIGKPDCPIPGYGITWHPIVPPVALATIPALRTTSSSRFTTVLHWNARAPIVFAGETYGQKDVEFWRFADLPKRLPQVRFEIALAGSTAPRADIAARGWELVDPEVAAPTPAKYLDYIAGSSGEFSVAVNLEVKARSGWFSDRSAAYLASGKPVVVQETGFSESLPCGEGLFAVSQVDEAAAAIETVRADYAHHCAAARRIAEAWFDAPKVIGGILRQGGLPAPSASR